VEIVLIAAAAAALYVFSRPKAQTTTDVTTPAPAPATALAIPSPMTFSGAGSIVSGGYQIAPHNSTWGNPMLLGKGANAGAWFGTPADPSASIANAVATSAATLASTIASPPVPAPAPVQRGGIAGTVGTGGLPLGSALRTGLSSGTGTTVVGTTRLQLRPLTKTLY
jgi:hypothetical protein